jgi:hypothetical protein
MDQVICICLSLCWNFVHFFHFFSLSCMFIVNYINFNVFLSCKMLFFWSKEGGGVIWVSEMVSLWKSLFVHPLLIALCQCVEFVCNTKSLFSEVMWKVFWYHNLLTTCSSINSLGQCWPGPEGAGLGHATSPTINSYVFLWGGCLLSSSWVDLRIYLTQEGNSRLCVCSVWLVGTCRMCWLQQRLFMWLLQIECLIKLLTCNFILYLVI